MIYALSNFPNLHKCDWPQIDTEHPQNGAGKLGLSFLDSHFEQK